MTSQEIISNVANDVNDIAYTIINRTEYVAMLNEVLREIGTHAKCYYDLKEDDLTAGQNTYSLTDKDVIKLLRVELQLAGSEGEDNWIPFREVAFNKIKNRYYGTDNSYSYEKGSTPVTYYDDSNNVVLTISTPTTETDRTIRTWYASNWDNGLYTLFFGYDFADGDRIRCTYFSKWGGHDYYDNVDIVDDTMANTVLEGLRWRVLRRVGYRRDENDPKMWVFPRESRQDKDYYYNRILPEFKRFVKSLGSTTPIEMKPFSYP